MHSTPPGSDPVFDAVVKMLRDWRQSADACTWSIMSVLLLARPLCPAFHMKEGGEQSATVERDVDAPLGDPANPEEEEKEKEPEGSEEMQATRRRGNALHPVLDATAS